MGDMSEHALLKFLGRKFNQQGRARPLLGRSLAGRIGIPLVACGKGEVNLQHARQTNSAASIKSTRDPNISSVPILRLADV